ncbi:MAG: hypothetical protein U0790_19130 [Isosphaeraceae bacterium]
MTEPDFIEVVPSDHHPAAGTPGRPRLPRLASPLLVCIGTVALVLGGLLLGFEPVGGDPDRMYRPIKQELARSLREGRLPWWSDRMGLGLPLLAESHVAALYPPNWLLYGVLGVSPAYRLAMWAHYLLLAAATYAYARFLDVSREGAALAGSAFAFCGFQAIHSSHEPFYHALAYVPLIVLAAERYVIGGGHLWLLSAGGLWGIQLTLGHFQMQWWTGCLVLFLGLWRVLIDGRPWTRLLFLPPALLLGAAIAAVQLGGSWELAHFTGFRKLSPADLAFFGFPPEHWAEAVVPGLFRGIPGGPEAGYWYSLGTTGYEACFYIGTLPLILAVLGVSRGINRRLAPWVVITILSFLLAILPRTWPAAQALVTMLPGFGWFRAPGRYVALTSLGLCLLAGCGMDAAARSARLTLGWSVAGLLWLAGVLWSVSWASRPGPAASLGGGRLWIALGTATVAWTVAAGLIDGWRRGRVPAWVLILATSAELGCLYYTSTTVWGWAIELPIGSPMLGRLAAEPSVGRVGGLVHDLPIRAGAAPIFPYTGFPPPPPHAALDLASTPGLALTDPGRTRLLRHGMTHGLWDRPVPGEGVETLLEGPDAILDRLVVKPPGVPARATWRLVRYRDPFPIARCTLRRRFAASPSSLLSETSFDLDPRTLWFLPQDRPPPPAGPPATSGNVLSFDGETALVEHDGSCDLVISRTFYPGWFASVNGGAERPVSRAELGIQSVALESHGPSRVRFTYRPTTLRWSAPIALLASALTLAGLLLEFVRAYRSARRADRGPEAPATS